MILFLAAIDFESLPRGSLFPLEVKIRGTFFFGSQGFLAFAAFSRDRRVRARREELLSSIPPPSKWIRV